MLSKKTISIFCDLLLNLAQKEKQVEINRQVLCQNINFDAYQVFSYLDLESKNYLNEINLFTFLNKNNKIQCTLEELQFFILLYDENFDAKLSYSEFLNFVLSDSDFNLRKKTRERICSNFDNNENIPFNVEYSLVKLFQKELDLIRTTRKIIEELKSCDDFNVHDLFHYLKGYGDITNESMKMFLENNCLQFDESDLRNIIKLIDLNKDSKIDFSEFHHFLCFPNLKCNCCSFCQCNCLVSNKNLFGDYGGNNNFSTNFGDSKNLHLNYNYFYKESNKQNISKIHSNSINNKCYNNFQEINDYEYENKYTYSINNNCCNNLNDHKYPCNNIHEEKKIDDKIFLDYINKLIEIEAKIEEAKINLINRPDFNIEDAFLIFSNKEEGVISFSDLQNGLNELGLYPSNKEIKLLMNRADSMNKGFISFEDFFDLLIPFQKEFRNTIERRMPSYYHPAYNKSDIFLLSTKIYLVNLVRLIIESENELNIIKEDMSGIIVNLNKIFNKIDKNRLGYINAIELLLFLRNNGINCNEVEINLIFIRLDKNKDEKIEIWEFEKELKPL